MSKIAFQLTKQHFKLLRVQYSPEYKALWPNFVTGSPLHPLYETQQRKRREQLKDGLWWHATSGSDSSKSSCVRGWARRRLRTAIIEALKARGLHENGKAAQITNTDNGHVGANEGRLDLKGSLRVHALPPLVPAKFVEVKAEVDKVIDILVQATKKAPNHQAEPQKINYRPLRNLPSLFRPKKKNNVA